MASIGGKNAKKMLTQPYTIKSCLLAEDSINSPALLQRAMYRVCSLHNIYLRTLIEQQESDHCKALAPAPSVDIVVVNLVYNNRRVQNNEISSHYMFASADMKTMSKLCVDMLPLGPHADIFRSAMQLGPWYRVLSGEGILPKSTAGSRSDSDREWVKET